ncbi:MAG: nucleotidyltransferase domain-containing protein [Ignavibacterium sp.]
MSYEFTMNKKTKNAKLNRLLPEIEKCIRDSFGEKVKKIILFGSYARGDFDEESDVDILVIVNDENLNYYKKKRTEIISDYLNKEEIFLSIIIEKSSLVERYKNDSPFLINVNKEGKVLYG